jgi:hypothetical protein
VASGEDLGILAALLKESDSFSNALHQHVIERRRNQGGTSQVPMAQESARDSKRLINRLAQMQRTPM